MPSVINAAALFIMVRNIGLYFVTMTVQCTFRHCPKSFNVGRTSMQVCKDDGIDIPGSEISAILNSLNCGNSVRVRVGTNGPKAWTSPFQSHIPNGFYSFGVFAFLFLNSSLMSSTHEASVLSLQCFSERASRHQVLEMFKSLRYLHS